MLLDNMDLVYISDFSLPITKTLTAKLARENVPVTLYTLDSLIEKQQTMPQQECPLVSEGHKAHHDDHHDDHHEDNQEKDHDGDDHHEDHDDAYDIHGLHGMIHNDKTGKLLVKDFQTENMSYYTLARDFPHNFARKGKNIEIKNPRNVVFQGLRQIGVRTGENLIEKHEIIKRKKLLPPTRYHKMIVVWLSEIEQVQRLLRMFAETITFCYQYIDTGIYDPNDG